MQWLEVNKRLQKINETQPTITGNKQNRENTLLTQEPENKSDDTKNFGISRPR